MLIQILNKSKLNQHDLMKYNELHTLTLNDDMSLTALYDQH